MGKKVNESPMHDGGHTPLPDRVGNYLIHQGILSPHQCAMATFHAQRSNITFLDAVHEMGFATEQNIIEARSHVQGYPIIDLFDHALDRGILNRLPQDICQRYGVVLVNQSSTSIDIAGHNFDDLRIQDHIHQALGNTLPIKYHLTTKSAIDYVISWVFHTPLDMSEIMTQMESWINHGHQTNELDTGPVVQCVNGLVEDAIYYRASDIHFEPHAQCVHIRYRRDGIMIPQSIIHKRHWDYVLGRIKMMANMNTAESRKPQNGRFTYVSGGRTFDARVASHPTLDGENIVIRLLDQKTGFVSINELGFSPSFLKALQDALAHPAGIILFTGPTGAGKTTSLYAILNHINDVSKNIMTLEEPVEYAIPMVRQTPIKDDGILNFADGVKSILRQDPDIVLIGEIRDEETAQMAIRSAMTGHQVLATLHAQDALSAFDRLIELGVSPSLARANITAVIAQRLVRKTCKNCHNSGCDPCMGTGYFGRMAIGEILTIDDILGDMIQRRAPRGECLNYMRSLGFESIVDDAQEKIRLGKTTLDEVKRHIYIRDNPS